MDNKYNIGLELFFINAILGAYIITSEGNIIFNYGVSSISSLIAVIINTVCYMHNSKNRVNLVFLILNMIVLLIDSVILISKAI